MKEISEIFQRPLAQVQILDRARALGQAYSNGAGARYYLEDSIQRMAAAPRYDRDSLSADINSAGFPSDTAVILRQVSAYPVKDDPGRKWSGFDLSKEDSQLSFERAEQTNASRMWWPVSLEKIARIRELEPGEFIPMFITVGGMIVAGRNIVGIDEDLSISYDGNRIAFRVEDASGWLDKYRFTWLSSGPGKAILWW